MEPKKKRYFVIFLSEVPKTDLYPDGKIFEIHFVRIKKDGKEYRQFMVTEDLATALDKGEQFIQTGIIN